MSVLTGQESGQPATGSATTGSQSVTDWRAGLPDDLKGDKTLESIKGKDWSEAGPVLAKQLVHAQALVGADKLVLPTDKSTPEEIAAFRRKLGVPEKATDYVVKLPDGVKEEQVDKKLLDTWRDRMHKQGIPKAQAESIINEYLVDNAAQAKAEAERVTKQQQEWETSLKTKFGADFDKNVNLARHALERLGSTDLSKMLDETGFGSHPAVVEFFVKAGRAIADDKIAGSTGFEGKPTSAAGAQAALEAFNKDEAKQKALWNKNDPNHDAVVKERTELFQLAANGR